VHRAFEEVFVVYRTGFGVGLGIVVFRMPENNISFRGAGADGKHFVVGNRAVGGGYYPMTFEAEVVDDSLYNAIVDCVCIFKPKLIVEIGSANGLGSTQAFIEGIIHAKLEKYCQLHCVEINKQRFDDLQTNTMSSGVDIVYYNGTTIPYSMYPTSVMIDKFRTFLCEQFRDKKQCSLEQMLDWKAAERKLVETSLVVKLPRNADMVMIDGSAFTGNAELKLFDQPRVVILDDVVDIKNYQNYQKLNADVNYIKVKQDLGLRNGYAIFARKL
jgi:hypothetical protein